VPFATLFRGRNHMYLSSGVRDLGKLTVQTLTEASLAAQYI
jgi:hypothetical protein